MDSLAIWQAIEATPVAAFIKESMWAYPILETVHLVGLGLLFGSIVAYDLRVLGATAGLPLSVLGQHVLPWVWTGFLLNAASGVLLFSSDAVEFASNPALQAKLVLIALAGMNAAVFQLRTRQATHAMWSAGTAPVTERVLATLSIVLWTGVIIAGRMMAYVK